MLSSMRMAGLFPAGHIPCERRLGASVGRSDGYEEWGNGDKTHVEWGLEGEHRETPHPTETEDKRVPKILVPHAPKIPIVARR